MTLSFVIYCALHEPLEVALAKTYLGSDRRANDRTKLLRIATQNEICARTGHSLDGYHGLRLAELWLSFWIEIDRMAP
jgi:hypothetical protein